MSVFKNEKSVFKNDTCMSVFKNDKCVSVLKNDTCTSVCISNPLFIYLRGDWYLSSNNEPAVLRAALVRPVCIHECMSVQRITQANSDREANVLCSHASTFLCE